MAISNKHGIERLLELDVVTLVDAACINPAIPRMTNNSAEGLQLHDAADRLQLVHDLGKMCDLDILGDGEMRSTIVQLISLSVAEANAHVDADSGNQEGAREESHCRD